MTVVDYVIGQEFEGHKPIEPGVLRFVHDSHASTAEVFNDPIVRDGLAEEWLRLRHWCGHLRLSVWAK